MQIFDVSIWLRMYIDNKSTQGCAIIITKKRTHVVYFCGLLRYVIITNITMQLYSQ